MSIFSYLRKKLGMQREINEINPGVALKSAENDCNDSSNCACSFGGIQLNYLDINENNVHKIRESFISLDIETTGLDFGDDRIVKISAVSFENGEIKKTFSTLVNSYKPIPESISLINHVTNSMLSQAPNEQETARKLLSFITEKKQDDVFICAYNANFEFSFLQEMFIRAGISTDIIIINTLELAEKYISRVENYKLASIEQFYGIQRTTADKSISDAESCGWILLRLLATFEHRVEKEKKYIQSSRPNEQELEICAFIQDILLKYDVDLSALRFRKDGNGYVFACCYHPFLKFKIGRNGSYVLVDSTLTINSDFYTEKCTESEGGLRYTRVYFSNPTELQKLSTIFYELFCSAYEEMRNDLLFSDYRKQAIEQYKNQFTELPKHKVNEILENASQKKYSSAKIPNKKKIDRSDVMINTNYSRAAVSEIKFVSYGRSFEEGMKYCFQGDDERKKGKINEAIALFDKARVIGYNAPVLYESYAKAFRKLKEYGDEILILDEGIMFYPERADQWSARRDRAIELLYAQQSKNN